MPRIAKTRELFVTALQQMLYVEQQLAEDVLPELGGEIADPTLRQGVERHLEQTRGHVEALERAFAQIGEVPEGEKSRPLDGLVKDHKKIAAQIGPDYLRDVFDAGAAARTEHLEIAGYRELIALAPAVGAEDVVPLLEGNLREEEQALAELELATATLSRQLAA